MLASATFRLVRPPVFVGSTAIVWGYLKSLLAQRPKYGDPLFRRFLRDYQWKCLIHGKARATDEVNKRQENVWLSSHRPLPTQR